MEVAPIKLWCITMVVPIRLWYCTLLCCNVLYFTALFSTGLYFTVLLCTRLYYTLLYFLQYSHWRVATAIEIMLLHVDNLKRSYEKEHTELEETRRVLIEHKLLLVTRISFLLLSFSSFSSSSLSFSSLCVSSSPSHHRPSSSSSVPPLTSR